MKKSTILFLTLALSLWSCENDISSPDLLGSYLDIKTGDSYEVCYQKLQDLYTDGQISTLYVDNVSFSNIENFNEQIELYTEFQIREKDGSNAGNRIAFALNSDTLQYLLNIDVIDPLTSGPTSIALWPGGSESSYAIKVGDKTDTIKSKIAKLAEEGTLAAKMNIISYTIKDLNTPYDNYTENSSYWSVLKSYNETDTKRTYFIIHFSNGVVYGIEILELKVVGLN